MHRGEGYRYVLGWLGMALIIVTYIGGLILILTRRHLQPARINSPFMMLILLQQLIPTALLGPMREISPLTTISCGAVQWFLLFCMCLYTTPQVMTAFRLYLVWSLENEKVALFKRFGGAAAVAAQK